MKRVFMLGCLMTALAMCQSASAGNWIDLNPFPGGNGLYGMTGTGALDVWFAGSKGTIIHWNGSNFTKMLIPDPVDLNGIWAFSETVVFAVGESGSVYRYNGTEWMKMTSPVSTSLQGVSGSGPSDVFACGDYETLIHWDGSSWQTLHSSQTKYRNWNGVWCPAEGQAIVVCDCSQAFYYDGTQLTGMNVDYHPESTLSLRAVWGAGMNDIYAAGGRDYFDLFRDYTAYEVLHWDGTSWKLAYQETYIGFGSTEFWESVHGTASDDVYVAGAKGVVHFNGTDWEKISTESNVRAVWAEGSGPVWAAGLTGQINRWDGSSWTVMQDGETFHLNSIWYQSLTDLFTGGESGVMMHWNGQDWTSMETGIEKSILTIWGLQRDDLYAGVQDGLILHYDGTSWSPSETVTGGPVRCIWGLSESSIYATAGSGLYHYNGSAWTQMTLPDDTNSLNGIWGSSDSDIFVVGSSSTIFHFDGSVWTQMTCPPYLGLTDVAGTSPDNVYACGDNGSIIHYDGSLWSQVLDQPPQHLKAISINDPLYIWAVGVNGVIYHYDGDEWYGVDSDTLKTLNDVCVPGSYQVAAAGQEGTVLVWSPNPVDVRVEVPFNVIYPGTLFYTLDTTINSSGSAAMADSFVALEAYGEFYFWPGWKSFSQTGEVDSVPIEIPLGMHSTTVIPPFDFPHAGTGSFDFTFYGLLLRQGTSEIIGDLWTVPLHYIE